MQKQYWLLKSEPDTFSIDDLYNAKDQTTSWEGVRNYQARNFLRQIQCNDEAFFYHSSCADPAIVGRVVITRESYPDPTAFNLSSPYFDAKSSPKDPRWFTIDVKLQEVYKHPLLLTTMKAHEAELAAFPLIQRGNRLSVIPVTVEQWNTLLTLIQKEHLHDTA